MSDSARVGSDPDTCRERVEQRAEALLDAYDDKAVVDPFEGVISSVDWASLREKLREAVTMRPAPIRRVRTLA